MAWAYLAPYCGDQGILGLTYMNLYSNILNGEMPSVLGKIMSLTEIFLENNFSTCVVPSSLANLTKLFTIGLPNNNFTVDFLCSGIYNDQNRSRPTSSRPSESKRSRVAAKYERHENLLLYLFNESHVLPGVYSDFNSFMAQKPS